MGNGGYPEGLRESIEKVEESRGWRLNQKYKSLPFSEREPLLQRWHPDYRPEGKRRLKIGQNRGDPVPHEVANLLEAYPLIDVGTIDLSDVDMEVAVLILGGGGAGASAALWANESGVPPNEILIATKLRFGDSNTVKAQGGIQAADKPYDSPSLHFIDVMGGGHFTNDPKLVEILVREAPSIIRWHEELGVIYDKDEKGEMVEISGGGTSRDRLHSAKDYTGLEIMRVLRDEALNRGIEAMEFTPAVELLTDGSGRVTGAVLWNMETKRYLVIKAKAVILATGGFGCLHIQGFPTTNHYGATMDGLVLAYRVGAHLRDMDSTQYHPTGAAYPEQILGALVTEKTRSLGAQLVNADGERFVYELDPRDLVSSAIIRECYGRSKAAVTPTGMRGVWLDTPMIELLHGEGTIKKSLSAVYRMFTRFDIDPAVSPLLVFPTLHYQNGGIVINTRCQVLRKDATVIEGFYAAGEVTGGVHGKNRLMGNSLLEINVFGKIAGINAAEFSKSRDFGDITLNHVSLYTRMLEDAEVKRGKKAPMLLPDYRGERAISRSINII